MKRTKRTTRRQRKAAQHTAAVMWRDQVHGRICAYRDEATQLAADSATDGRLGVGGELAAELQTLGGYHAAIQRFWEVSRVHGAAKAEQLLGYYVDGDDALRMDAPNAQPEGYPYQLFKVRV